MHIGDRVDGNANNEGLHRSQKTGICVDNILCLKVGLRGRKVPLRRNSAVELIDGARMMQPSDLSVESGRSGTGVEAIGPARHHDQPNISIVEETRNICPSRTRDVIDEKASRVKLEDGVIT